MHIATIATATVMDAGGTPSIAADAAAWEVTGLSDADVDAVLEAADQELASVLDLFFSKAA